MKEFLKEEGSNIANLLLFLTCIISLGSSNWEVGVLCILIFGFSAYSQAELKKERIKNLQFQKIREIFESFDSSLKENVLQYLLDIQDSYKEMLESIVSVASTQDLLRTKNEELEKLQSKMIEVTESKDIAYTKLNEAQDRYEKSVQKFNKIMSNIVS